MVCLAFVDYYLLCQKRLPSCVKKIMYHTCKYTMISEHSSAQLVLKISYNVFFRNLTCFLTIPITIPTVELRVPHTVFLRFRCFLRHIGAAHSTVSLIYHTVPHHSFSRSWWNVTVACSSKSTQWEK